MRPADKLQDCVSAFMVGSQRARLGALTLVHLFVGACESQGLLLEMQGMPAPEDLKAPNWLARPVTNLSR